MAVAIRLSAGFALEDPPVALMWGASPEECRGALGRRVCEVSPRYLVVSSAISLAGLTCEIGLHFDARDRLRELEFFRTSQEDPRASYHGFQRHFEAAFGTPTTTVPGPDGFADHHWLLGPVEIEHRVFDRFGPEEHMRVRRIGYLGAVLRRFGLPL